MKEPLLGQIDAGPFAIRTDGLVKRYGPVTALDGVDLRVPDGAVYVLVGANGAGKTTLIQLLLHALRADAGTIEVCGIDVRRSAPLARAQVGYVPEHHRVGHPRVRVGRLLEHHAVFYPAWDHAYAKRILSAFEIDANQSCGALSKGQRRRLQLLLALAHRPPVLLLDEPEEGLDHMARDRASSMLSEHLADSPTTVLISTHRADELEGLIDHVGVLHRGMLVGQTTREQLRRTLRRYRADVPADWIAPAQLASTVLRRGALGRGIEWTILGEQPVVVEQLTSSGAVVRDVSQLSLDESAVALLAGTEAS